MSGYPPENPTNFVAKAKNQSAELTWTDPEDLSLINGIIIKWAYTRIVRKMGSVPKDENDGTIVLDSSIRNQYSTNPFVDTGLINDTLYYYAAFSCSEDGIFNKEIVTTAITPTSYKTMTVIINEADRNPATCCSYADDAVNMPSGKDATEWADFFGYKPCLFKDGQVVGYLNPNNYAQFEDGTPADITSGDAGDVMVEFPRRGIKISKSESIITVSMTDNPDDPEFTYYAHSRGESRRDYFYLGAYLGYREESTALSISGKTPTVRISLTDARSSAQSKGTGYELMTFYQRMFLQVMYLLQFKNLDSQTAVGKGYTTNSSSPISTGNTNTSGLIYGSTSNTGAAKQIKIFGIEDAWGNLYQWIDGVIITEGGYYKIAMGNDGFNNSGSGYVNQGCFIDTSNAVSGHVNGYISKVVGSSELGFLPTQCDGSSTFYYSDHGSVSIDMNGYPYVGGRYGDGVLAGIFHFSYYFSHSSSAPYTGIRISYY